MFYVPYLQPVVCFFTVSVLETTVGLLGLLCGPCSSYLRARQRRLVVPQLAALNPPPSAVALDMSQDPYTLALACLAWCRCCCSTPDPSPGRAPPRTGRGGEVERRQVYSSQRAHGAEEAPQRTGPCFRNVRSSGSTTTKAKSQDSRDLFGRQ